MRSGTEDVSVSACIGTDDATSVYVDEASAGLTGVGDVLLHET